MDTPNTTDTATPPTETPPEGETPETWDTFLEKQPPTVKALYIQHTEGLKNTVKSTREERDDLAKQIRDLSKSQKEGSEAKAQLDKISAQLEITERRAAFLEEALNPALQVRNPRAAWLLAEAGNHFKKNGAPDWDAIKNEAPELFGLPTARANAGQGTQSPPNPTQGMNEFIRRSAGRGV